MRDGSSEMILRNLTAANLQVVVGGSPRRCDRGKGFVLKGADKVVIGDIPYFVEPF